MDKIVERVFERTVLIFLAGFVLLLLGITGGISIGGVQTSIINDNVWRVIISLLGFGMMILGVFIMLRENKQPKLSVNASVDTNTIFSEWDVKAFKKRLSSAKEIYMVSTANYNLLGEILEDLQDFVRKGGKIRAIYTDPDSQALEFAAERNTGHEKDIEILKQQYSLSIQVMREISKITPVKDNVQVKKIEYLHSTVITIVDRYLPTGTAYVTINGFEQYHTTRPCAVIQKEKSTQWFEFFDKNFENMWNSNLSKKVDL